MGFLGGTHTCTVSSDLLICRLGKFFTTSDQGRAFFDVSACSRFTALLLGYDEMSLSGDPSELSKWVAKSAYF